MRLPSSIPRIASAFPCTIPRYLVLFYTIEIYEGRKSDDQFLTITQRPTWHDT